MIAYASSLDQGGPMAQTAQDCALLLNAMAGLDPMDSTTEGEHPNPCLTWTPSNSVRQTSLPS